MLKILLNLHLVLCHGTLSLPLGQDDKSVSYGLLAPVNHFKMWCPNLHLPPSLFFFFFKPRTHDFYSKHPAPQIALSSSEIRRKRLFVIPARRLISIEHGGANLKTRKVVELLINELAAAWRYPGLAVPFSRTRADLLKSTPRRERYIPCMLQQYTEAGAGRGGTHGEKAL